MKAWQKNEAKTDENRQEACLQNMSVVHVDKIRLGRIQLNCFSPNYLCPLYVQWKKKKNG